MSPITMEQAQEMVKKVDTDDDGKISKDEFQLLMQPLLLDEYVSPEQDMEDLRAIFKDADLDHSGFLSIDEFYQCLMKMGADINREEIVSLFTEFDINGDMQIDIDEFVTIMAVGDQINFIE
jgi:Ca2+-binding EF-hand superfamily protein